MPPVQIGVGMLGYAFMGKAHSRALRALPELDPPLLPELVSISGRNREELEAVAARFGWAEAVTDWREQVADDRIQLYVNGGPNSLHAEPSIAALEAGKHVLCEKPLGLNADESYRMWQAAKSSGRVHACGFNYRFVPAIRRARELLEAGAVGDIVHFRARYLQSWGWDADTSIWRFDRAQAATGAIGDLGAHIIDLARFLAGEIETVSASVRTYVPGHEVDDAFTASIELAGGAIGTLEASRLARGRVNQTDLRDQRLRRLDRLRPGAVRRADGVRRRPLPDRAPQRRLVAARPSDRLGRHVHPRVRACLLRARRRDAGRALLRDVRGRLPGGRGL